MRVRAALKRTTPSSLADNTEARDKGLAQSEDHTSAPHCCPPTYLSRPGPAPLISNTNETLLSTNRECAAAYFGCGIEDSLSLSRQSRHYCTQLLSNNLSDQMTTYIGRSALQSFHRRVSAVGRRPTTTCWCLWPAMTRCAGSAGNAPSRRADSTRSLLGLTAHEPLRSHYFFFRAEKETEYSKTSDWFLTLIARNAHNG